jgi:hypothetical protein
VPDVVEVVFLLLARGQCGRRCECDGGDLGNGSFSHYVVVLVENTIAVEYNRVANIVYFWQLFAFVMKKKQKTALM